MSSGALRARARASRAMKMLKFSRNAEEAAFSITWGCLKRQSFPHWLVPKESNCKLFICQCLKFFKHDFEMFWNVLKTFWRFSNKFQTIFETRFQIFFKGLFKDIFKSKSKKCTKTVSKNSSMKFSKTNSKRFELFSSKIQTCWKVSKIQTC